jgi:hypothetical protein
MALELNGTTGVSLVQNGVITDANLPAGSVLQVVQAIKTDTFSTSSTSFVDVTGMSATLTPASASNKVLVIVNMTVGQWPNNFAVSNLVRNGTAIAQPTTASTFQASMNSYPGDIGGSGSSQLVQVLTWLDSPNSVSAVTYKVQMLTTGGTAWVNARPVSQNGTTVSSITLMEIAA